MVDNRFSHGIWWINCCLLDSFWRICCTRLVMYYINIMIVFHGVKQNLTILGGVKPRYNLQEVEFQYCVGVD